MKRMRSGVEVSQTFIASAVTLSDQQANRADVNVAPSIPTPAVRSIDRA